MSIIELNSVTKQYKTYNKKPGLRNSLKDFFKREYKEKVAVNNVSFNVEKGEIVGFLGSNGAGKTTTLKMLSGVLYPTSGEIRVLGFNPVQRKNEFLKSISFIMGNRSQLLWDLPAEDSFLYQKKVYQIEESIYEKNLNNLTKILNVDHLIKKPVRQLSLGERMKMELINGFLYNPEIVFLDEPTIGLDLTSQKEIRRFIEEYRKENNATIIITSHYMSDIENLADRVVIIKEGNKVFDNSIVQLNHQFNSNKVITLKYVGDINLNNEKINGKVIFHKDGQLKISVKNEDTPVVMRSLLEMSNNIVDISVSETPFESIIEEILRRGV